MNPLWAAACEVFTPQGWKTTVEYIHAEDYAQAKLQVAAMFFHNRYRLIALGPAIGYSVANESYYDEVTDQKRMILTV